MFFFKRAGGIKGRPQCTAGSFESGQRSEWVAECKGFGSQGLGSKGEAG